MYRVPRLRAIGGFSESLRHCEEFDLNLRLSRRFPAAVHDEVIASYRQHAGNKSRNLVGMLGTNIQILRAQRLRLRDRSLRRARKKGVQYYRTLYGNQLVNRVDDAFATSGVNRQTVRDLVVLSRYYPGGVARRVARKGASALGIASPVAR
jgi:hypothetical protein